MLKRSHKIGLMEVGEELGRRGHQVTVVSPQRYKAVPPNVTDIVIESEFEALSSRMTTELVANDKPSTPPFLEVTKLNRDTEILLLTSLSVWLRSKIMTIIAH